MKQLPDLAQSFARMKTILELEEKVNVDTIFGFSIKKAFIDKESNYSIIQMIKDQIKDCRESVVNCIPEYLVKSIETNFPDIPCSTIDDLKNVL